MVTDPFRGGHHKLVLCDVYTPQGEPAEFNYRHLAKKVFAECDHEKPWFGIEQEYILFAVESAHCRYPIGWGLHGYNAPQGLYYCGVGSGYMFGRELPSNTKCLPIGPQSHARETGTDQAATPT